jgi:hypothetical protein
MTSTRTTLTRQRSPLRGHHTAHRPRPLPRLLRPFFPARPHPARTPRHEPGPDADICGGHPGSGTITLSGGESPRSTTPSRTITPPPRRPPPAAAVPESRMQPPAPRQHRTSRRHEPSHVNRQHTLLRPGHVLPQPSSATTRGLPVSFPAAPAPPAGARARSQASPGGTGPAKPDPSRPGSPHHREHHARSLGQAV